MLEWFGAAAQEITLAFSSRLAPGDPLDGQPPCGIALVAAARFGGWTDSRTRILDGGSGPRATRRKEYRGDRRVRRARLGADYGADLGWSLYGQPHVDESAQAGCLTRACSRQAGPAPGSARAVPSDGAAKEAQVCAGAGPMARS
jgi:hypothetical protein